MAEFYVKKPVGEGVIAPVHLSTCSQLPEPESLMYLGSYASAEVAYKLANGYFPEVGFCPDCLQKAG